METIILLGIGILAAGILVRQFVRATKVAGCACCGQSCSSHCHSELVQLKLDIETSVGESTPTEAEK
ncbi:MAG: hypothetical protein PHT62_08100 [Desulfotomaculaceae bacterium]|nr:hypothetical protein [Desulfotomaculaceae bacterium]